MTTDELWKYFEQQVLAYNQAPADYITTKGESTMTQTLTAKAKSPTTIDADVYSIELDQPTELKLWDEGDTCTLIKRDGMYILDSRYAYVELEISSRTDLWLFQCFEGFMLNNLEDIPEIIERHKDGELTFNETSRMIQFIIQNHEHKEKPETRTQVNISGRKLNTSDFEAAAHLLMHLKIQSESTMGSGELTTIKIHPSSLLERNFLLNIEAEDSNVRKSAIFKIRHTLHRLLIDFTLTEEGTDEDETLLYLRIPTQMTIGTKELIFDSNDMFYDRNHRSPIVMKKPTKEAFD